MQFTHTLPWWGWILVLGGVALTAYGAYTRTAATLGPTRRSALTAIRALMLLLLVLFLLRPTRSVPSKALQNQTVPVLVDVSRSMNTADAKGRRRIEYAADLLTRQVLPAVSSRFHAEVLTFGESIAPASSHFAASARRSDLSGALQAVGERYRGRAPGVVVLSDGGDTSGRDLQKEVATAGIPVFPIGIGNPERSRDREVLSLGAGEANVENALLELAVSAVSYGYGVQPIELRLLANDRLIDRRVVAPSADGAPVHETFLVAPDRAAPTVFTIEIPQEPGELVADDNRRSILVAPPGRARRVLFAEGAPGFEHSFIKRAWAKDPSIEFDAVVRKGQNNQAQDTFYLQASPGRGASLLSGFPTERRALYAYDAIVLANVEGDFFTRDQLSLAADFVAERGGGLLLFGARSFARGRFIGTMIEEALPLELSDRRGGVVQTAAPSAVNESDAYKVALTPEGEQHPVMRLGLDGDETRRRWALAPALASIAMLGSPRPASQVLAVTRTPDGGRYPLVAIQRYGRGRSMIFAGEASWRWRMGLSASDRTHELFWRQTVRWLSAATPDAVTVNDIDGAMPGDLVPLDILVRDGEFSAVPDAMVKTSVTLPGGETREWPAHLADAAAGRYRALLRAEEGGIYRVAAEARRADTVLGTANRWMLVGGADLEMADPRLNEDLLRGVALASGGRYLREEDVAALPTLLTASQVASPPPDRQDIWNNAWGLGLIVLLLSAEWILRRRWGMR